MTCNTIWKSLSRLKCGLRGISLNFQPWQRSLSKFQIIKAEVRVVMVRAYKHYYCTKGISQSFQCWVFKNKNLWGELFISTFPLFPVTYGAITWPLELTGTRYPRGNVGESLSMYEGIVFLHFSDRWDVGHIFFHYF